MNRRNIRKAIQFLIDSPPPVFNMGSWYAAPDGYDYSCLADALEDAEGDLHACGTSACLAGTIQFNAAKTEVERESYASSFAREYLGIHYKLADKLFLTSGPYGRTYSSTVTEEDAIEVLIAMYNMSDVDEEWLASKLDYSSMVTIARDVKKLVPSKQISRSDFTARRDIVQA